MILETIELGSPSDDVLDDERREFPERRMLERRDCTAVRVFPLLLDDGHVIEFERRRIERRNQPDRRTFDWCADHSPVASD